MHHKPVCIKCNLDMRPEKTGVVVLDMADYGPYKMTHGDIYKCPECGYEIVTAFGDGSDHHSQEGFEGRMERAEQAGILIVSRVRPR